jgi:hypothetical protein
MEKYKPSNGAEGMFFMEIFCFRCKHYEGCDILNRTLVYNTTDAEYPDEWQYDPVINANTCGISEKCTAFEEE